MGLQGRRKLPGRAPALLLLAVSTAAGAAAPAQGGAEQPDRVDCGALVEHRPAPDVEYRPGVDVEGNPVAPADLGGRTVRWLPETLSLALTADLAERLGLLPFLEGRRADLSLGTLTVQDGRVFLDDRPLFDADAAFVAELCRYRAERPDR